jgi:hypothetical protein
MGNSLKSGVKEKFLSYPTPEEISEELGEGALIK